MSVAHLIREAQKELFAWIPYEEYQKMFPSENREKIRNRLREGTWVLGVHASRPSPKRELWINLRNVKAWVEKKSPQDFSPPPSWPEHRQVVPAVLARSEP